MKDTDKWAVGLPTVAAAMFNTQGVEQISCGELPLPSRSQRCGWHPLLIKRQRNRLTEKKTYTRSLSTAQSQKLVAVTRNWLFSFLGCGQGGSLQCWSQILSLYSVCSVSNNHVGVVLFLLSFYLVWLSGFYIFISVSAVIFKIFNENATITNGLRQSELRPHTNLFKIQIKIIKSWIESRMTSTWFEI